MLEHSRKKFRCYFVVIPALRQIESVKSIDNHGPNLFFHNAW
jgi:hypothetical protein